VSINDEIKVVIEGYSETGKVIASHRVLLGSFRQNLSLVSEYSNKGRFSSDSVTATVVSTDFNKTTVEITPNLCAHIYNSRYYGLEIFDKVMVTLRKPKNLSQELSCTIDHIYYDEKNYVLNNFTYFIDNYFESKVS